MLQVLMGYKYLLDVLKKIIAQLFPLQNHSHYKKLTVIIPLSNLAINS